MSEVTRRVNTSKVICSSLKRCGCLNFFPDTDTLSIDLAECPRIESEEASSVIVLDVDSDGNIVGIEIEPTSKSVDLS